VRKKVLILGSTGMLGHQVFYYLSSRKIYDLYDISHFNKLRASTIILDITQKGRVEDVIRDIKPDFIINCIGILVHASEANLEKAIYVNACFPHQLRRVAGAIGAKLIHISTDCVFSGEKGRYKENDVQDGKDYYAKTKILGEVVDSVNLTIRTSIIGSELKPDGTGLFHWFMAQSGVVEGYKNAIWSGVTTLELSKAIEWSINENITGIYHITNGKSISKYELLELLKRETGKKIDILPVDGKTIDKSFVDTRKLINYTIPDYPVMIKEMIQNMRDNSVLYGQYNI